MASLSNSRHFNLTVSVVSGINFASGVSVTLFSISFFLALLWRVFFFTEDCPGFSLTSSHFVFFSGSDLLLPNKKKTFLYAWHPFHRTS